MMEVTPQRLHDEQKKGTPMTLVDVREQEMYTHAHIASAMHMQDTVSDEDILQQLPAKDAVIVVYDKHDDGEAVALLQRLEQAGYTKLGHLVGGLMAWQEAGYPIESGVES